MKLYISKPAIVSSAGINADDNLKNLLTKNRFLSYCDEYSYNTNKSFMLGKIKYDLAQFPKTTSKHHTTRTNQILLTAVLDLVSLIERLRKSGDRIGIVIGTTTSGIEDNFEIFKNYAITKEFNKDKFDFSKSSLFNPASFLSDFLSLKWINFCISTACTSGAKAIMESARLIKAGICDSVVCGGVDSLNSITINGFDSLQILTKNLSNPFSKNRDGINIGEGAGIFVISKHEISDIVLAGYSSNCDAFHTTQPDFSGKNQGVLIENALKMADLSGIDYVNLHGTGTYANDKMEALVVSSKLKNTPASSIKPAIGHTLGAAGAIEFGICSMICSSDSIMPPHIYDGNYDDEIEQINLVGFNQKADISSAMSLSFAFGGDNTALILKKVKD